MKKHQGSVLIIVLILIGLVAIGTGAYLYKKDNNVVSNNEAPILQSTSTIDKQVAGYKTYRNNEYGFEFEYPSNLTLKEMEIVDNSGQVLMSLREGNLLLDGPQSVIIDTLDEIQKYVSSSANKNIIVERYSDKILSVKGYYRSDANNLSILIEPKPKKVIQIESYPGQTNKALYVQILNSIKFK